jgi:hypothetical protein
MKLINGKGQLGEALKKADIKGDWTIYHTWDFENKKDLEIQRDCYRKFVKYVDTHPKEKIVFISTLSQEDTFYSRFKRLAEIYLKANGTNSKIIRICSIIGKGTYQGFRENKLEASGDMEVVTLSYVIEKIMQLLESSYTEHEIHGDRIPAKIVKELILFGKNGKATQ